ncbi:MAG: penicillin-binding protein 2 [Candidatus Omnitrophica bacterium]|nr:penicillin-binding protein 2 [Candidatus Omnitrophota bacterium]
MGSYQHHIPGAVIVHTSPGLARTGRINRGSVFMRIKIYAFLLAVSFLLLIGGLGYIQITKHAKFKVMSEENRLKVVPLMAPRGAILDRKGEYLAKDVLSFDLSIIYSQVKNINSTARAIASILGTSEEEVAVRIKQGRWRPYSPVMIAEDIGIEKAIYFEEISVDQPGILIDVSSKRKYANSEVAANVVGYLGLINRSEFDRLKHYGYRVNDLVGRGGIEKTYDDYLRGTHGGKQVEVDHRGREIMVLGLKEPVPGKDLYLTIDLELQKYCDSILEGKRGSILAMDPETGAILAMASAPSFDPEIFIDARRKRAEVAEVLNDAEYPLLNRAISGVYPPGSVFKTVLATAGLETGVVTAHTVFNCTGSMRLGRRAFHCWRESGHGDQNLEEAIKNSCNVYFWRLGSHLGVDNIAEYAGMFGVGRATGVDLPAEADGLLPSREWKRKKYDEPWYKGETLNYSVGQGYVLCSPLQVCRIMSVFANGGYLVRPYIAESVEGVSLNKPERTRLDISEDTLEHIREGLRKVVNDRRGTGMKARLSEVVVAGKTGTAQTSRNKNHGWFAGFAPFDGPKLTIVVFDEYGGKGGYFAAGTAGKIFKKAEELGLLGP